MEDWYLLSTNFNIKGTFSPKRVNQSFYTEIIIKKLILKKLSQISLFFTLKGLSFIECNRISFIKTKYIIKFYLIETKK